MNTKHKKIINIFTLEFFLSFFSTLDFRHKSKNVQFI